MVNLDAFLDNNRTWVNERFAGSQPVHPDRKLAVVACMDSRMPIFQMLGLASGDAHIIRNAGGVITDDVIRSLMISQRLLGTVGVLLIHHTDCGLTRISEDQLRAELEAETGLRPSFSFEAFTDPFLNVQQSMRRLMASPFIPHKDAIHGLVYDVDTGVLHPVPLEPVSTES